MWDDGEKIMTQFSFFGFAVPLRRDLISLDAEDKNSEERPDLIYHRRVLC